MPMMIMLTFIHMALAAPLLQSANAPGRTFPDGDAREAAPFYAAAPMVTGATLRTCDDTVARYDPAAVQHALDYEDWAGAARQLDASASSVGCSVESAEEIARFYVQRGIAAFMTGKPEAGAWFVAARARVPGLAWSEDDARGAELFTTMPAPDPDTNLVVHGRVTLDGRALAPGEPVALHAGPHALRIGERRWALDLQPGAAVLLDPASPEVFGATATEAGRSALSQVFMAVFPGTPVYVDTASGAWKVDGAWMPVTPPPIRPARLVVGGTGVAVAAAGLVGLVAVEATASWVRKSYYNPHTTDDIARKRMTTYERLEPWVPATSIGLALGISTVGVALVVPFGDGFSIVPSLR